MARHSESLFSLGQSLFQRIRTLTDLCLRRFGIHCATHQIRLILISAVVITSLSYPALALYSATPSYSRLVSTSNVLDSFLAAYVASSSYAQRDLRNFWQGHPNLQLREDAISRARCGNDRTLRVEKILIRSDTSEETEALNHQTLLSALQLERRILQGISSIGIPCLEGKKDECIVLSPLAFWNHNEEKLRSDSNISNTLLYNNRVSVAEIPVTPQMVLAGRGLSDRNPVKVESAMFLALTFLYPESDCSSNLGHNTWVQVVANSTYGVGSMDAASEIEPTLMALEYDHSLSGTTGISISIFLYLAYIIFIAYVSWSMNCMDAVHSRIGLTFTALFEIAASTITSLSVCALIGFKVTMVPWSLLPIVIIFVGAENMFNLVDAVTKTSVTLPVKERIAEGLSRAGTSNTLKVVSYNCILGVIAFFSAGPIRQFCSFAIVVLIAHWFLAHTFFLAVLSIDIQRLELDELLQQNSSLAPAVSSEKRDNPSTEHLSTFHKFSLRTKDLLQGRALKNISLLLLLATTATLYFMTRPNARTVLEPEPSLPGVRPSSNRSDPQDPALRIWKVLNPNEDPLVHLRLENPIIVTFQPNVTQSQQTDNRSRVSSSRTLGFIWWLVKLVVLPMSATIAALYGLLLYLLKDAEYLEAQRNRAEADVPPSEVEKPLQEQISFTTLPRAFATDVELLATSRDGSIIVAVGLQNEVVAWRVGAQISIPIDTTDVLLRTASTSSAQASITTVAVDDNGEYCAVGTGAGAIGIWSLAGDTARSYVPVTLDSSSAGVVALYFAPSIIFKHKAGPYSRPNTPPTLTNPVLLAAYENGIVARWDVHIDSFPSYITPSSATVARSMIIRVHDDDRLLAGFSMMDGTLEVSDVYIGESSRPVQCSIQAGNPSDLVARVDVCHLKLDDKDRIVIGAATEAGVVSLWDGWTGELIFVLDETQGPIDQLRISPTRVENCRFCGELPLDTFLLSLSSAQSVSFYRVFITSHTRRCSCPRSIPRKTSSRDLAIGGRRSRSSSIVSVSGSASATAAARRLSAASISSASDASAFPVSGHGVHSRRATEKDTLRRPSESFPFPPVIDEYDAGHLLGPLDSSTSQPPSSSSSWASVAVTLAGEVKCERGGWDTSDRKVVGVRRVSRTLTRGRSGAALHNSNSLQFGVSDMKAGLTPAALDRWEVWIFDSGPLKLQSCVMSTLVKDPPSSRRSSVSSTRSSPSGTDYSRLPFTRVSPFVIQQSSSTVMAGFGNTVGLIHLSPFFS
ncbi:sterol-sensing domain of SREBP cleavage-activation-domain-containing protein [Hygrophoropsis aurantiaca]|uniref:Sterol-sensing domain of SREBP cleavage-activation-domain-containing protein n=1 Tax=Hygrophoropsis aurantiaca TaxID=72124 RepID=A0ACB8AAU6_9AGAM|nr:sterol-sensing domain of SREBP cleavage-activation-domain-containing protein [Hygrophoropsis aurantiaca]